MRRAGAAVGPVTLLILARAMEKMERTLQWDEALDIGSDTGTAVDDADYQSQFPFDGTIGKITLTIDRPKLSPEDIKKLEVARQEHAASK